MKTLEKQVKKMKAFSDKTHQLPNPMVYGVKGDF